MTVLKLLAKSRTLLKFFWIPLLIGIFFAVKLLFLIPSENHEPTREVATEQTPPLPLEPSSLKTVAIPTHARGETTYNQELEALSQLDEHPEMTERKLKSRAQRMSPDELQSLYQKVLNPQLAGDDRWLAVYLLSLSEEKNSISLLEDVVLSPTPTAQHDLRAEFEKSLRAQAIEGLQNQTDKKKAASSLHKLTQKLDDGFLLDRAQRALSYLENGTPPLEEQDRKALENLVQ